MPVSSAPSYTTVKKPVRTLAALCAEAGLTRIDFLKIDVEGAEAEAIAGMDFKRWRPRVVLVEAIAPGSMAESWAALGAGAAGGRLHICVLRPPQPLLRRQ